jgi:hypothetical protein
MYFKGLDLGETLNACSPVKFTFLLLFSGARGGTVG